MSNTVLQAFLKMKPRAGDAQSIEIMTNPELRAKLIVQIERFPAVALPDTENPVLVAGAVLNDEMVELWMVAGEGFEKQLKPLLRQIRHLISTAQEAFGERAIKLCIDPDRPGTERFAQAVGFVYENRKAVHVYTLQQRGK